MLIKLSLVVAAFYYVHFKLRQTKDLDFPIFIQFMNSNFSLKTIIELLLLSSFNWVFEILKWQELVSGIKKIYFKQAMQQCLAALTASLFTPNRIGDYGAKALYFTKPYRKRILFVNFMNNMLQMGVTVSFGVLGFLFFIQTNSLDTDNINLTVILLIFALLLVLFGTVIKKSKFQIKGFSFENMQRFIIKFPIKNIVWATGYALARYLVFSFQFYHLLILFGMDITYFDAMTIITSMYFISSIIPSVFILDVIVKGGVAVYLFSLIGVDKFIVVSGVTAMWILNFVLPSIIGSYYVLQFKFPEDNQ